MRLNKSCNIKPVVRNYKTLEAKKSTSSIYLKNFRPKETAQAIKPLRAIKESSALTIKDPSKSSNHDF